MIIEKKLDEEIFHNDYEYFFTFLSDRFEYASELWQKELTKKFSKKFKPIWILYARQNQFYEKGNYIVINKEHSGLKELNPSIDIVIISDHADLTIEFSSSEFIKELTEKLIKKQGRLFILPFTTSGLTISYPEIIILGPDPDTATKFDNKIYQVEIFKKLKIPFTNSRIYETIENIDKQEELPFFISAAFSCGGNESSFIYSEYDLDLYKSKLRVKNRNNSFIISDLIPDVSFSPNVNAIICGRNDTRIIAITDQLLIGTIYLGNIYPSKATSLQQQEIIDITKRIGNYLSENFKGVFGLDFIVDSKGKIYCVEINPRRQGGYACNILMSERINIPEVELKLFLGEKISDFNFKDFKVDYSWGHIKSGKIMPSSLSKFDGIKEPFIRQGKEFRTYFYPEKSKVIKGIPGYYVTSGKNYNEVKEKISKEI